MKTDNVHTLSLIFGFLACLGCISGARAEILLEEYFNYPHGRLADVSGGAWELHSPGTEALFVVDGAASVGQSDALGGREDVHRLLSAEFDQRTDQSTRLYAGFTVSFTSLPFSKGVYTAGSYFAHFRVKQANVFYALVGANTEGAVSGYFRLAVANSTWNSAATVEFPQDLQLGVSYNVVVRLDLGTDQATLWVNPTDESSPSVTATDPLSFATSPINSFALRQGPSGTSQAGGASGQSMFDNLVVATKFSEALVVPEPSVWSFLTLGVTAFLWPQSRRRLARRR